MIRHPSTLPKKKVDELRKCSSCGLTVMAKGDNYGWKGVDLGGGQMDWFCDKLLCRQARDETIQRRSRELLVAQQQSEREAQLSKDLNTAKARIADLEKDLRGQRQTTADDTEPAPAPGVVTAADGPIVTHLAGPDGKTGLCGSTESPRVKSIELTWDMNPCPRCQDAWAKIQAGEKPLTPLAASSPPPADPRLKWQGEIESADKERTYRVVLGETDLWTCECQAFKYRQTCRHIALGQKSYAEHLAKAEGEPQALMPPAVPAQVSVPVPAAPAAPTALASGVSVAAAALYGERPKPAAPKLEDLPKFTPDLIERAQDNPQAFAGKVVMVPPEAYPDMDLGSVEPDQLRGGIGALFGDALEVDRIEHARRDGKVVGIVFSLRLS